MKAEALAVTKTADELKAMWSAAIVERNSAKTGSEYRRLYQEALHISTALYLQRAREVRS